MKREAGIEQVPDIVDKSGGQQAPFHNKRGVVQQGRGESLLKGWEGKLRGLATDVLENRIPEHQRKGKFNGFFRSRAKTKLGGGVKSS